MGVQVPSASARSCGHKKCIGVESFHILKLCAVDASNLDAKSKYGFAVLYRHEDTDDLSSLLPKGRTETEENECRLEIGRDRRDKKGEGQR